MKKIILLISVLAVVLCNSCTFSFTSNQKDLQKQITQLQQEVAALQKLNGLTPSYDIKSDSISSPVSSNSNKTSGDGNKAVKKPQMGKEETAVEAIKYCLKMYLPDLKYSNIRSVPQSDGTIDVIIDYKDIAGFAEHTYYNVSVYSNNEFKVNSCRGGYEGDFPHNSRMKIQ